MVVEKLRLPSSKQGQRPGNKRARQGSRQVAGNLPCKQTDENAVSRQWPDVRGKGKTYSLESRKGCEILRRKKSCSKKRQ